MDVAVAEISREVRELRLRVDTLPVPLEHPVNDEGVAQIMDAWPAAAWIRLEAGGPNDPVQQVLGGDEPPCS